MLHVSRHENSHSVSPANPPSPSLALCQTHGPWSMILSNQRKQVTVHHLYRCFVRLQTFVEVCVVNMHKKYKKQNAFNIHSTLCNNSFFISVAAEVYFDTLALNNVDHMDNTPSKITWRNMLFIKVPRPV